MQYIINIFLHASAIIIVSSNPLVIQESRSQNHLLIQGTVVQETEQY